jgi:hypothetical protein
MAGEGGPNRRLAAARRALGRGYLRELHTATRPHARLRDVAELRHSISRLTQVPA